MKCVINALGIVMLTGIILLPAWGMSEGATATVYASGASSATYNVTGDADDEILDAIGDLTSDGGRIVLSEGTFVIGSTIELPDNVVLEGQGMGVTILKVDASTAITAVANDYDEGTGTGNANVHIKNITIDGNESNQSDTTTTRYGIHFRKVSNGSLENVEVMNVEGGSAGEGVRVSGVGERTCQFKIVNLHTHDNTNDGVRIMYAVREMQAVMIDAHDNGGDGIVIDHSEGSYVNLRADNNTGDGIFIRNVFGVNLVQLDATRNGQHGINVLGMTDSIGGDWQARNNSDSSSGTYSDVFFAEDNSLSYGRTNNSVISGVVAGSTSQIASATEKYGLEFEDTGGTSNYDNLSIYGLRISGTVTGDVSLPTTRTKLVVQDHPASTRNFRVLSGDVVLFDGEYKYASGNVRAKWGNASISPDGSGNGTIAHGITGTPSYVQVGIRGDNAYGVDVQSVDSTNITVRVKDASGNDVTSGTYTIDWLAKK